jgi:hypothetical protein
MESAKILLTKWAQSLIKGIRNGWNMDHDIDTWCHWYNDYESDGYGGLERTDFKLMWDFEHIHDAVAFLNELAEEKMFAAFINYEGHFVFIREKHYIPDGFIEARLK